MFVACVRHNRISDDVKSIVIIKYYVHCNIIYI